MPSSNVASTETEPAIASGRWRRLQGIVNTRLFGDAAPQIGRYRLLRSLGSGAMGVVFCAHDVDLQREVAIKLLKGDGDDAQRRRLQREARAMAKVRHPNVVGVYDVGQADGELYVAMEMIAGTTLRAWLDASVRERTWRDTVSVFLEAARGLAAAHAAGLVHRDFKPENVLVGTDGRVCVVDFGLVARGESTSEPLSDAIASTEQIDLGVSIPMAGTPAYMAPEQVLGRPVDARADVWSFCVALFEALHGTRPFDRGSVASTLAAVVDGDITWPAGRVSAPARIERLIRRGLRPDRDERTLDMATIVVELRAALVARRRRWTFAGGTAIAASLLVLGARELTARDAGCSDDALTQAWNDDRRAAIADHLPGDVAQTATSAVERHVDAWKTQLAAACTLAADDPEALAQRMCLQQRAADLDATTMILSRAEGHVLRNLDGLLTTLVDPSVCADPQARPPLHDETMRPEAAQWRYRLAEARASWNAGDDPRAQAIAKEVYEQAHAAEAWVVAADAGVLYGEVAFVAGDYLAEELPVIEGARDDAARASFQGAASRANALLVHAPTSDDYGALEGRFSGAMTHARSTRDVEALAILATAVAAGWAPMYGLTEDEGDALLAEGREAAGKRLGAGHRLTRALQHPELLHPSSVVPLEDAEALLAEVQTQWGAESGEAGRALLLVASAHAAAERWTEAIDAQRKALEIFRPIYGVASPAYSNAMHRLMKFHIGADELDEALVVGRQTLADTEGVAPDPRWFATGPANVAYELASALVRDGRVADALELAERADAASPAPHYSVLITELRLRRGDVDGAEAAADAAWRMVRDPLNKRQASGAELGRVHLALGLVHAARGRSEQAAESLQAAAPLLLGSMAREHLMMYAARIDVAHDRGDLRDVELHVERGASFIQAVDDRDPARAQFETAVARL